MVLPASNKSLIVASSSLIACVAFGIPGAAADCNTITLVCAYAEVHFLDCIDGSGPSDAVSCKFAAAASGGGPSLGTVAWQWEAGSSGCLYDGGNSCGSGNMESWLLPGCYTMEVLTTDTLGGSWPRAADDCSV